MPAGGDAQKALVEVLHMFTEGGRDARILAYAMLFVLNRCPHSMEDIAERIGCTRAAISKEKRRIEDRLGAHSRVAVSPESRVERAAKCRARGQKKPRGQVWRGLKIWREGVMEK
jgi:DNA-binding CsgD family transcriptional regulator